MYSTKKLKWIICQCCQGNGNVDHPAFSNGITSSEWADMDEDGRTAYMRGDYDVRCDACNGTGKVQVPNVAAMSFGEKRAYVQERREAETQSPLHGRFHAEVAVDRRNGF